MESNWVCFVVRNEKRMQLFCFFSKLKRIKKEKFQQPLLKTILGSFIIKVINCMKVPNIYFGSCVWPIAFNLLTRCTSTLRVKRSVNSVRRRKQQCLFAILCNKHVYTILRLYLSYPVSYNHFEYNVYRALTFERLHSFLAVNKNVVLYNFVRSVTKELGITKIPLFGI